MIEMAEIKEGLASTYLVPDELQGITRHLIGSEKIPDRRVRIDHRGH